MLVNLHNEILEIIQAISILLVFVTSLFTLKYTKVTKLISKKSSEYRQKSDKEKYITDLKSSIIVDMLPQLILTLAISILLVPVVISVQACFIVSFKDIDILVSLFIIIVICIWSIGLWNIKLLWSIITKIIAVKKKE